MFRRKKKHWSASLPQEHWFPNSPDCALAKSVVLLIVTDSDRSAVLCQTTFCNPLQMRSCRICLCHTISKCCWLVEAEISLRSPRKLDMAPKYGTHLNIKRSYTVHLFAKSSTYFLGYLYHKNIFSENTYIPFGAIKSIFRPKQQHWQMIYRTGGTVSKLIEAVNAGVE